MEGQIFIVLKRHPLNLFLSSGIVYMKIAYKTEFITLLLCSTLAYDTD